MGYFKPEINLFESEINIPETPTNWPENTFFIEMPETKHFMASHWEPFFDDAIYIIKRLPEITANFRPLQSFGSFYTAPRKEPETWARGWHFVWPNVHKDLIVTLRFEAVTNFVASIYPYYEYGIQASVTLKKVKVWDEGVEAQIVATWGDASVTFFDTHFLINRTWYETGKVYDFILLGIAYEARPSTIMEIPFTPEPEVVAWLERYAKEMGKPPPVFTGTLSLKDMAMFFDIPEWDKDDYKFRGPVRSVKEVEDILGQYGWLVRATVMRFGDEDADLDILITCRAWKDAAPPEIGQDIEGTLWLQGHLWSNRDWENTGQSI